MPYPAAVFLFAAFIACAYCNAQDDVDATFFEKNVRPLLAAHCYKCHSQKSDEPRGGLRLDTRDGLFAGGDSGEAVVAGSPQESMLLRAVRYEDPDLQMPPDKRLSEEEISVLEEWIRRGAVYPEARTGANSVEFTQQHWAFQTPVRPPLPELRQQNWAQNPIDAFILAKLESHGLTPQSPADKRALLRRVTYDLTGLPPAPEEIDAFLRDDSPGAFAAVVDRLLASPRYGERWARHWLDLVRYTDDFEETWRYRDWVVNAFNQDMRYDQFIVNQVAGDLIPAASSDVVNADGIVATTVLSIGPWGGIDRKKRLADIVDDQIDVIGRTFLGLTLACARCHNHKFDPVTTEDYYALAGIFYSSRVISDAGYLSHGTKRLRIPLVPADDVRRFEAQAKQISLLEQDLHKQLEKQYSELAKSIIPRTSEYLKAAWAYDHWMSDSLKPPLPDFAAQQNLQPRILQRWMDYLKGGRASEQYQLLDNAVPNYDGEPGVHAWRAVAERPWWGVNTNQYDVPIETFALPPRSVCLYPNVDGTAVAWTSPIAGRIRVSGRLQDADPLDGVGIAWTIDHVSAIDARDASHDPAAQESSGVLRHQLAAGKMPSTNIMELEDGSNGDRLNSIDVKIGDAIYFQAWLSAGDAHYDVTSVELAITSLDDNAQWNLAHDVLDDMLHSNPHSDRRGNANVWSFYDSSPCQRKHRLPAVDRALAQWDHAAAEVAAGNCSATAMLEAADRFQQSLEQSAVGMALIEELSSSGSPFWEEGSEADASLSPDMQRTLATRRAELDQLKASLAAPPCAHGVQEGGLRFSLFPTIQDVPVHLRGNCEQLGESVPRGFPKFLRSGDGSISLYGSGRLELARWIGSADNPLAARVMVNRIWQHHFGNAIVRTPSNFGFLGDPPSHPELLDWLACELIASRWSIKHVTRLIVTSATYQQSSQVPEEQLHSDPHNLYVGRMNRRRLDAEQLRDSLLAVCNRLDLRSGGPPDNADSRRRMLYLKSSRSEKSGFGALFDAADPAIHVENRSASTVAPQALDLMNGSLTIAAATDLADDPRMITESPIERIQNMHRLILGRDPSAEELAVAGDFLEQFRAQSASSAATSSLDAWEALAQVLLLTNEFLYVD